jgi:hypothetical protein
MDDKFLYQLQEVPDLEFVNNLHKKLGKNYSEPEQRLLVNVYNLIKSKRLVQATAFLVVSLIVIMAISPARAFVSSLITNIAGQIFEVTEDYPGDNHPGDEEIIEPQVMSLSDALARFPHDIQLPTYIPSGYTLNEDNVRVYVGDDAGPFQNTIEFEWLSDDRPHLRLSVTDIDPSISEIVAPGSIEEVLLDANHSAVLIQGGWDADHKVWTNDVGLRLRWSVNNLAYDLAGVNREQLIEIAISTLK